MTFQIRVVTTRRRPLKQVRKYIRRSSLLRTTPQRGVGCELVSMGVGIQQLK